MKRSGFPTTRVQAHAFGRGSGEYVTWRVLECLLGDRRCTQHNITVPHSQLIVLKARLGCNLRVTEIVLRIDGCLISISFYVFHPGGGAYRLQVAHFQQRRPWGLTAPTCKQKGDPPPQCADSGYDSPED